MNLKRRLKNRRTWFWQFQNWNPETHSPISSFVFFELWLWIVYEFSGNHPGPTFGNWAREHVHTRAGSWGIAFTLCSWLCLIQTSNTSNYLQFDIHLGKRFWFKSDIMPYQTKSLADCSIELPRSFSVSKCCLIMSSGALVCASNRYFILVKSPVFGIISASSPTAPSSALTMSKSHRIVVKYSTIESSDLQSSQHNLSS